MNLVNILIVDVRATTGTPTRKFKTAFAPIQDKAGIFVFFHKATNTILYVGFSSCLYSTNGGPGPAAQMINGDNTAVKDELSAKIPGATIDDCSIFFIYI